MKGRGLCCPCVPDTVWLAVAGRSGAAAPRLVEPKSQASIRSVPLPDRVAVGIDQHLASCPVLVTGGLDGLLIRNSRGGPVWPRTFHARIFQQATEAAALPGVRFHDLRHFYASALTAAGESVITVQAALGHASAVVRGAAGEQKRSLWRALAWLSLRALTAGPAPWLHRWHRESQARVPDDRCAHRRRPGVIEGVRRACPDLLVCSGASGAGQSGRAAGSACRVRRWSMAARSAGSRLGHSPAYTPGSPLRSAAEANVFV